jgi:hypothetical protein
MGPGASGSGRRSVASSTSPLDEDERFLELGQMEVESGDGLLDANDSFVLGLDDRADTFEVGGEAREDAEKREHVAYPTVQ